MKRISRLLIFSLLVFTLGSCEKDENKIYYEDGVAPVLWGSKTGTIPLSFATQDQQAIRLAWTNPEYQFTTGVSSQNVSYLVEIDTMGANFTNPKRQSISVSQALEMSFTQAQLNDYLLNQLVLVPGIPHNIEMRVKSSLGSGSVPLLSNVLQFEVTPFVIPPKVTPPGTAPDYTDGKLYITGSATPASWMADNAPELASQKFTRVSSTLYVLDNIYLTGGNSYLFVPVYGNWSNKYGFTGSNNANNVNGDDFKKEGGDIKAPAVSGNYKIEVDFQRGKFIVTKL